MTSKCSNEIPGTIVETAVLAFELVGGQIKDSPQTLTKIVQSRAVQNKIREALQKRLNKLRQRALTGRPVDSEQALQSVTSVFTKDGLDAAKKQLSEELKKSHEYRQLECSLKALKSNFKDRPLGVFVDEPEGVLLIVVTGLMIAGAAGMYIAITDDSDGVINGLSKLAEVPSITMLGKVDLGLTDITIKPSEKNYSGGISAKISKWKAVKEAQLKIVVQKKADKVATVPISVETKVDIAPSWSGNFAGGLALDKQGIDNVSFSLGIEGKADRLSVQIKADAAFSREKTTYGGSGSLKWNPGHSITVTGGAGMRVNKSLQTNDVQTEYSGNVGFALEF